MSDLTFTRHDDGKIVINWPNPRDAVYPVDGALIEQLVETCNDLVDAKQTIAELFTEANARLRRTLYGSDDLLRGISGR